MGKRYVFWLVLFLAALGLAACGAGGQDTNITTLIFATMGEGSSEQYRAEVQRFNLTHSGVRIEVQEYCNENGRSGKDRLMVEMAAGKIPDMIDLGSDAQGTSRLPYPVLARKGFLEDLWPYIENDPQLGRESLLDAPLKAAEVNGGLYTIFSKFHIETVVGAESVIGDRKSWTLPELLETFSSMPEGSTIFAYFTEQREAFYYIFSKSIENYVDRNTGACTFTGEQFKSSLQLVSTFLPSFTGNQSDKSEEMADRILRGRQMLAVSYITNPREIQLADATYGLGKAVFIGYPTEDGSSGSSFYIEGHPLAMSSTCQNKDAAWDFLREILLPRYSDIDAMERDGRFTSIPVNRSDYDLMIQCMKERDLMTEWELAGFPIIEIHRSTDEEIERFEDLVNGIETINLYDQTIYDIAYEVAGAYFTGDKTLDEVAQLIQDRVSLYLQEQM